MNPDQTRDLTAFILVGAMVAGAAQFFIGTPAARGLAAARADADNARASLTAFQSSPTITDPATERARLLRLCELAASKGRPARDAEALLTGIHRIAADCNVSVDAVRPTASSALTRQTPATQSPPQSTAETSTAVPDTVLSCDIALSGEYDGVVRFLLRLKELGWHKVQSLRIAPTGADTYPTTEARLELSLFDFTPPDQSPALSNPQSTPTPVTPGVPTHTPPMGTR